MSDGQYPDDGAQTTIDHRLTSDEEKGNTGQDRRNPWPTVTKHPSPENQWKQDERRPGQGIEEQHLPPNRTAHKLEVHGSKGREHGDGRQEKPSLYCGHHKQRHHQGEMRTDYQAECRRTRQLRRGDGDTLRQEKACGGPSGEDIQFRVPRAETAASQRPPDNTESRQNNRADHRHRWPWRQLNRAFKGQQYHHGDNQSGNKEPALPSCERCHPGRHVQHEDNAKKWPRRHGQLRSRCDEEQKGVTHQQQICPAADNTRPWLIFRCLSAAHERRARQREQRKARDDNQRRHQPNRHIRRDPPCRHDEPGHHGSDNRQHRESTRRSFQEKPRVHHHQQ